MKITDVRVALQQRVLPEYRVPFFNALGKACVGGLEVFAGLPRRQESIVYNNQLTEAHYVRARNLHLFSGKTYFCAQFGFIQWLEQYQPQVLIVEANPRYLTTPAAIQRMHHQGLPVLGWGLGAPKTSHFESAFRWKFLKSLDGIIAYSQTGAQQYIDAGFAPDRVFVAPNAVTSRPQTPPLQRSKKFQKDRATILFVGRLQERKRLDVLLHACARLPSAIQPRLVIVGDGPDRPRLEKLAAKEYPKAVFAGAKYGIELETYFNNADLFVLPGTGGLAVQQAMAYALPVIVGEADGTQAELVRPENGWLLSEMNIESLTSALTIALDDVGRLRRMGDASYQIISEEVNLEVMVQSFLNAIEVVLKG
jgi:glycosyltransferase involved in cell wall biosynthesis